MSCFLLFFPRRSCLVHFFCFSGVWGLCARRREERARGKILSWVLGRVELPKNFWIGSGLAEKRDREERPFSRI